MLFSASVNAYDTAGEFYVNAGNCEPGLLNYKKTVAIDPENDGPGKPLKYWRKEIETHTGVQHGRIVAICHIIIH